MASNYIYHHGILGQKWGVRRFQNKDGSLTPEGKARYYDTVGYINNDDLHISKGTVLNRVGSKDEVDNSSRTYASIGDVDKQRYISIATEALNARYALDLTAVKDLNIAGPREICKAMMDTIGDRSIDDVIKQMNYQAHTASQEKAYARLTKETRKKLRETYDRIPDDEAALKDFATAFIGGIMTDSPIYKDFFRRISERGFDGVIDLNDKIGYGGNKFGGGSFADNPIVLVNRMASVMTTNVHELSYREVDAAMDFVRNRT